MAGHQCDSVHAEVLASYGPVSGGHDPVAVRRPGALRRYHRVLGDVVRRSRRDPVAGTELVEAAERPAPGVPVSRDDAVARATRHRRPGQGAGPAPQVVPAHPTDDHEVEVDAGDLEDHRRRPCAPAVADQRTWRHARWLSAILPCGFRSTIISTGHIDGFDIDYVGGRLILDIRDHTVNPINDDLPADQTLLVALPGSLSTVPSGPSFGCLGTAGSPVYLLPQQQDVNLLWPGLDTGDVPSGQLQNNKVRLELVSSTVPAGARFALYTTSLGSASFRLNTNTAPGCQITTWPGGGIDSGTHAHAFRAFSTAGIYTLTFRATATTTGGAAVSSGDQTYTFLVG